MTKQKFCQKKTIKTIDKLNEEADNTDINNQPTKVGGLLSSFTVS